MNEVSKLSIVVDTTNAKVKLAEFTNQLNAASEAGRRLATVNQAQATSYRQVSTGLQTNAQFLSRATSATRTHSAESVKAALTNDKLAISASKLRTQLAKEAAALQLAGSNAAVAATRTANLSRVQDAAALTALRLAAAQSRAALATDGHTGAMNRASASSRGLYRDMSKLYTLMNSGLVVVFGLGFIKTAAEMQNLNNQIRLVTKSDEEMIGMKKEVIKIANENYSSVSATVGLYQKSARALSNLGKSQQDTLRFTEAVSLAMRMGGRSAGENAAAILQLGQAMGAGVIMGDEFRSISENAPLLLSFVAKEMGVAQGELKKLSRDGEISAEVFFNAMEKNLDVLKNMAEGVPITMSQAFMVAKNNYMVFMDDLMNGTGGASDKISGMLVALGNNFGALASIIGAAVVGVLTKYAFGATTAALATNGLTLSALGNTGAFAIYATSVGAVTGLINGYIRVATIAGTVASRVMSLGGLTVSGAFTAVTGAITAATGAVTRWSTYSGVATGVTSILAGAVSVATGAFMRLAMVINAHPLMALATVLFAVVASTKDANGEMLGLSGAMSSLGDTISVVGEILGNFIGMGVEGFSSLLNGAMNMINGLITGSKDGTDKSKESFSSLFGVTETGFLGIAQGAASAFDAAGLTIISFAEKAVNHLLNMVIRAKNAYNGAKEYFGWDNEGQAPLRETNIYSLMDNRLSKAGAGNYGLRAILDGAISNQKDKKAAQNSIYNSSIDEMLAGSGAAHDKLMAKNAAAEAAKDAKKGKDAKDKKDESNQMKVYKAFMHAGMSDNQARIITAEIGRENSYQDKYLFGNHKDQKNGKTNVGMVSWQAGRDKDLLKYLGGLGLVKNGKIEKSQESLNAQAMFVVKEITGNKRYSKTLNQFLGNEDVGYNEGTEVLGKNYFQWRYTDPKYKDGHTRRDKHYEKLNAELGNKNIAKSINEQVKAAEDSLKLQLELYKQYGTKRQEINAELDAEIAKIRGSGAEQSVIDEQVKQAEKEADAKYSAYADGLTRQIGALNEAQKTERQMIKQANQYLRDDANNNADLNRKGNEEFLTATLTAIDVKEAREIRALEVKLDKEYNDLYDFNRTEKELFEKGWLEKMAAAELATDELKQYRLDAYAKQLAKEREMFANSEEKKKFELLSFKFSDGEKLLGNELLNKRDILNANYSEKERKDKLLANEQPLNDAFYSVYEELNPVDPLDELTRQYERKMSIVEAYEKRHTGLLEKNSRERNQLTAAYEDAKQVLLLEKDIAIYDGMSKLASKFLGEQSGIYRGLYALQKAYAFSSALISSKKAIMDAWSNTAGGYWAKAAAAGQVALSTAPLIDSIVALAPKGFKTGGYTGNMGVNQVAGAVHGQEYVFDAKATRDIGVNNLEALRSGKSIGGGDVNINVNVDAKGNAQVSGDNERMGRDMANGIKAVVMDTLRKEKRQGGMLYGA